MKSFCLKSLAIVCALACGSVFAQNSQQTAMDKFNELINAGIFTGTNDGNNQPLDEDMTRDTAAAIVARLVDLDTSSSSSTPSFSDVDSSQPWYSYIQAAATPEIIGNQETPTFSPRDEFTGAHLTQELEATLGPSISGEATSPGADDTSSWARAYIAAAQDLGLFGDQNDYSGDAERNSLVQTAYAPNPTAAPGAAGATESTKGETVPEDPTEDLKSKFEEIMGMINDTLPPDPEAPPGPDTIGPIQQMADGRMGLPGAAGGNNPDDPDNQLALADNNVGNDISLDSMMNEAVDNTIANAMTGTYTGNLTGEIATSVAVGGIISLEVGLTGADYFDGNVTFNSGASGTVKLDMYNAHDGTFKSSGVISSSTISTSTTAYTVDNMTVDGIISGKSASGDWSIDLSNKSDGSSAPGGGGTFTATTK
jgi:hypothetical protein